VPDQDSRQSYSRLKEQVSAALADGKFSRWPDDTQRVDWAYGNTKIENEDVTREMVQRAVLNKPQLAR
jgi:hypothetical protein